MDRYEEDISSYRKKKRGGGVQLEEATWRVLKGLLEEMMTGLSPEE